MSKTKTSTAVLTAPAPKTTDDAPEPTLSEYQAIAERLADGLSGVEGQQAEHRAALATIAEALAALPSRLAEAQGRLSALQQEQAMLPRRINAARALVVGSTGTQAEGQAKERLETLLARQHTLPPEVAEAEAAERTTRVVCEQEQARLTVEQAEHQAAIAEQDGYAEALREAAQEARRQVGAARLAQVRDERQTLLARVAETEAKAQEERDALAAFDAALPQVMAEHPTHLGEALQLLPKPDDPLVALFRAEIALIQHIEAAYFNPAMKQQPTVASLVGGIATGRYLDLDGSLIQQTITGNAGGLDALRRHRLWLESHLPNIINGSIINR